jgi:2-desacetyl-2-hydroxyethyl bacteriochlorophyllide A dehydrogenase
VARVVRFASPFSVTVVDQDDAPLGPTDVRLRTLYSGISAGTELTFYRGTNPYLDKHWDNDVRLFVPKGRSKTAKASANRLVSALPAGASRSYPLDAPGYEEVGEVVEVGSQVDDLKVGQLVWGTWGHRSSVVMSSERAAARVFDPQTNPVLGVFSQIGAVALNAVLDADIHVSETVAVFGAGVPGQLVAQLARLNGGRVIAVDTISQRLEVARRLGAWEVLDASGEEVAERIRALTEGRGADVCIEVSGAYRALNEAIRSVAYSARVVVAGFFQGGGTDLTLGEEMHHNRVQLVGSQIAGVSPSLTYRWDIYRLQKTFIDLAVSGQIDLEPLISHRFPADEAPKAFELLDRTPEDVLQVVLEF